MQEKCHFTSVAFSNYKAFSNYSVSLKDFNVLVGPNNSGKSTILGAFRLLSEGIRKARARKPTLVHIRDHDEWGYSLSIDNLPIATKNAFTDYDDSRIATISFRISNGNILKLIFPEQGVCYLVCETAHRLVRSPTIFKREYNLNLGFVPVLGPVEQNEPLYQEETARLALLTPRASRNFRNIWYHFPTDFEKFRELIRKTWRGMDIEQPKFNKSYSNPELVMYAIEDRIPREMFWVGFGFQVWCQMLTYIVKSKDSSLLLIDEPDIYLHADLQRQLVDILKNIESDILIATHSTEIISEVDPRDLLIIDKSFKSAKRISTYNEIQRIFSELGSTLNPILTQLAKSGRVVFVEGKDFNILSKFARKLNKDYVANKTNFAVIHVEGFNPQRVKNIAEGIEKTLGTKLIKAVILDKDYRSEFEVEEVLDGFGNDYTVACIHDRKELENFLLEVSPIERAIQKRLADKAKRTGQEVIFNESIADILIKITDPLKHKMLGQYLSKWEPFEKKRNPKHDGSTINTTIMKKLDELWDNFQTRMMIIPGKDVFSDLNTYLQENFKISLTPNMVIDSFQRHEVPEKMVELIEGLERLSQ